MSMIRLAPLSCAVAMLASVAGTLAAQGAPTATLSKSTGKSKYTLGNLFSLQELPDGRVVASDTKEQLFRLVDLSSGSVGIVGKQGDDAESYRTASLVIKLPGDSLGLYDPAGRKLLHVSPTASVDRFVALPTMANNRRIGTPLAMDQSGAIYFTVPEKVDTVTKSLTGIAGLTRIGVGADADEPQMTYRTRRADQVALKGRMPYIFKDGIAIRSDGLMARVISDSYQVVWGRNGKEIGRTAPLPYTPVLLSEAEIKATKDSVNDMMKSMMANMGRGGGPGGSGTASFGGGGGGGQTVVVMGGGGMSAGSPVMVSGAGGGMMIDRAMVSEMAAKAGSGAGGDTKTMTNGAVNPADLPWADFPSAKPPIPSSGTVAMFDASGNLWIARTSKVGDAVPHYDVVSESKGLIGHVNLPTGTRLLGFGKNAVYVARSDEGSDWLERYAMPKLQ